MRILIIEDEKKLARAIHDSLESEHYEAEIATTGEDGFFRVNSEIFDLVILDLMLPGRDGFEILSTLRRRGLQTPVLILTAKDSIGDRVHGLDHGADDYMVKPFAFPELHARIRTLLRRGRSDHVLRLKVADLEMDLVTRAVVRAGTALELTVKEFEVLEFLMRHAGQVIPRDMLARDIWGDAERVVPLDNVIDVHMARLRRKLDAPFNTALLHTIRGVGFVLRQAN